MSSLPRTRRRNFPLNWRIFKHFLSAVDFGTAECRSQPAAVHFPGLIAIQLDIKKNAIIQTHCINVYTFMAYIRFIRTKQNIAVFFLNPGIIKIHKKDRYRKRDGKNV